MATTIPTLNMPSVGNRALGAPQVQALAPDDSGAQLLGTAANVVSGLAMKAKERADTASVMDAEAQLTQFKLDTMFNPETGVYTKKGKSALDVTNQTLPLFQQRVEQISKGLTNDQQRARFQTIAAGQYQQLNGELNRYEYGERKVYEDNADKANIATSIEGAIKYANDPQMIAYYQNKGSAVIAAAGRRNGLPPEAIALQLQNFNSETAVGVITHMASKDPMQAQQYWATAAPMMNAGDQAKIAKMLGTSVRQQMAQNIASSVWDRGDLGDDALVALIIQKESAGDTNAVSTKGARGVMQLMPDTAKEVAEKIGVPYDESRLTSDPTYNTALGTAYLKELLGRYGGNQTLAVAAYNAGPGKVDEWIQKNGDPRGSETDIADWIARIPYKETRDYTASIMASSAPTVPASQRYADGLKVVNAIQDPQLKKFVADNLDDRKKQATAQEVALYDQAADYVSEKGYSAVPAALLTQLKPEDQVKLRKLDDNLRKGAEPKTDYEKLEEFLSMPDEQLAQLSLARDIQPHLSKADFNTVRMAWQDARGGDGKTKGVAKAENDAIVRVMNMAGILTGNSTKAKDPVQLQRQDQFRSAVQSRKDSFVIKNGRQPTVNEVQDLAETLLLDVRLSRKNWLDKGGQQLWEVMPEDLERTYIDKGDITIDKIPAQDRRKIVMALRGQGRVASEPNIIAEYLNSISGLGVGIK